MIIRNLISRFWKPTFIALLSATFYPPPLPAETPVLLKNAENGRCASGIKWGNSTITALHYISESGNSGHQLIQKFYSSDIAVLDAPIEFKEIVRRFHPREGEKVTVLHFPHCKSLEKSEGFITSVNHGSFIISAPLAHGSSGGGVFDKDGKLIGIVHRAENFTDGIRSRLFKGRFNKARISLLPPSQDTPSLLILRWEREINGASWLSRVKEGAFFAQLARTGLNDSAWGTFQEREYVKKLIEIETKGTPLSPSLRNQLRKNLNMGSLTYYPGLEPLFFGALGGGLVLFAVLVLFIRRLLSSRNRK